MRLLAYVAIGFVFYAYAHPEMDKDLIMLIQEHKRGVIYFVIGLVLFCGFNMVADTAELSDSIRQIEKRESK